MLKEPFRMDFDLSDWWSIFIFFYQQILALVAISLFDQNMLDHSYFELSVGCGHTGKLGSNEMWQMCIEAYQPSE